MLATIPAATLLGVEATPVRVEVHVTNGLPGFTIIGQPDAACREARDRVRAALLSAGLRWPNRRMTVNLAPSGVRKVGGGLDLAIAIGLAVADEQLEEPLPDGVGLLGELGLDGSIRRVPGMLSLVDATLADELVVPAEGHHEASLVAGRRLRPVASLGELVAALRGDEPWPDAPPPRPARAQPPEPDLEDVRGQGVARRAVEVAAAGGHHLLMVGPPGAGKTMLARRLPGLLPSLAADEAFEVTRVHSVATAAGAVDGLIDRPPFRSPHHGASAAAVIGGGTGALRPGEASLATGGVLFLDELGEFPVAVLEALRTPLEEGVIRIARAQVKATLPARFLLVAAMNPCPCGFAGQPGRCRCSGRALARYARRLSGPLLDRFDLCITVVPPEPGSLLGGAAGEPSWRVAERVAAARAVAATRGALTNSALSGAALEQVAPLESDATALLEQLLHQGRLSPRGLRRVRSVALTIADLEGVAPPLTARMVAAAVALRCEPAFVDVWAA